MLLIATHPVLITSTAMVKASDVFPNEQDPEAKVKEVKTWLNSKGVKDFEPVSLFCDQLGKETVKEIEALADSLTANKEPGGFKKAIVKGIPRQAVLKPSHAVYRLQNQHFALGDRVTMVQDSGGVPLSFKGVVIGMNAKSMDVVWDAPFMSGTTLGDRCVCSSASLGPLAKEEPIDVPSTVAQPLSSGPASTSPIHSSGHRRTRKLLTFKSRKHHSNHGLVLIRLCGPHLVCSPSQDSVLQPLRAFSRMSSVAAVLMSAYHRQSPRNGIGHNGHVQIMANPNRGRGGAVRGGTPGPANVTSTAASASADGDTFDGGVKTNGAVPKSNGSHPRGRGAPFRATGFQARGGFQAPPPGRNGFAPHPRGRGGFVPGVDRGAFRGHGPRGRGRAHFATPSVS